MAGEEQERHRPSALKQQNKTHKTGRHKSKGELQKIASGRVNKKASGKKLRKELGKQGRRFKSQQIRKQKYEDVMTKKRSRGGADSPPFLVVLFALSDDVDIEFALGLIQACDEEASVTVNDQGICHISVPRFRQRFAFISHKSRDLYALLDSAKVADCLLLLASPETGVDGHGYHCLSCLFAQGLPSTVLAIPGIKHLSVKKQGEARKYAQKTLESWFPGEKLFNFDTSQEALLAVRAVGNQKLRSLAMREHRPHMMAEAVKYTPDVQQSTEGTLSVSGYVRSQAFSVNGLVHLPGWGDFQLSHIDVTQDPSPIAARPAKTRKPTDAMETCDVSGAVLGVSRLLEKADPARQETLQREVIPDPMEGEQTWPTEEELAEADAAYHATKKVVHRVPKGTSEYQAAWIVESDQEDEDEDEVDDSEDDEMMGVDEAASQEGDTDEDELHDEYETMTVPDEDDAEKYDEDMDMVEEMKMLNKLKEARNNVTFPDEVDTPQNVNAKTQFQKYRGLKSFRTSPWDVKENLPTDYSRIFQFENFKRTKARVLAETREEGAQPGWYVTLHIKDVPAAFMDSCSASHPVVVFGLLPHEQKMSVVNLVMKRHPDTIEVPVKSKERMVFHIGYRRFTACPVYSTHTNANKHKFERFFNAGTMTVATMYAPIMFPPASVLMFRENATGEHQLMATGSVLGVNPSRVVVKRIVLSGHPYKINRKMAVIRYMFFNRDDIVWFKPVELRTKWGRRGHIREPLGTHGHMKCVFDGALKSQDTILMNLYKRVYPKWTYDPHVSLPGLHATDVNMDDTEESVKNRRVLFA